MVTADARLGFFLVGSLLGFVLGYLVRSIREIKDRVEEVDKHVLHSGEDKPSTPTTDTSKKTNDTKKDGGFINRTILSNVVLLIVVALTVYSAFASQSASNKVKESQSDQNHVVACNQDYLTKTIAALNARTENSNEQNKANLDLQRAQSKFLGVFLLQPPPTEAQRTDAFRTYFAALTKFTMVSGQTSKNVTENPYPTQKDYTDCLNKK